MGVLQLEIYDEIMTANLFHIVYKANNSSLCSSAFCICGLVRAGGKLVPTLTRCARN